MSLMPFYWGIGLLAVAGGGWILLSTNRGGSTLAEPLPASEIAAAAGFPGYTLGSDAAPVVVDEYADYQCPYCGCFWALTFHDVEDRLIPAGKVRWRFHDRPIDGAHAFARVAAHAAACADEQGRFWPMHEQLFSNQGVWSQDGNPERVFRQYAQAIGLDLSRYDDCMKTGRYRARIQAEAQAADQLSITSTPTVVIGGMRMRDPPTYDQLKRIIDSLATKPAQRSR
jgi:protein-disulfide isomerase